MCFLTNTPLDKSNGSLRLFLIAVTSTGIFFVTNSGNWGLWPGLTGPFASRNDFVALIFSFFPRYCNSISHFHSELLVMGIKRMLDYILVCWWPQNTWALPHESTQRFKKHCSSYRDAWSGIFITKLWNKSLPTTTTIRCLTQRFTLRVTPPVVHVYIRDFVNQEDNKQSEEQKSVENV